MRKFKEFSDLHQKAKEITAKVFAEFQFLQLELSLVQTEIS